MDWVSGVVVYILLWWWVFFMTLPFGARAEENLRLVMHRLRRRNLTCLKSGDHQRYCFVLWIGVDALIDSGVFSFREMVRNP